MATWTAPSGHLAAAAPHAKRIGNRVVSTLALARSLDAEQAGDLPRALAVLTGFADNAEELDEIEDLLPDGVRLATKVGDTAAARALTDRAEALAQDSAIPHRQANALFCRGLLDRDAGRLLQAADRYRDARPAAARRAGAGGGGRGLPGPRRARAGPDRVHPLTRPVRVARCVPRRRPAAGQVPGAGHPPGPPGEAPQARRGWDSLTPTEVKITELVAQGLSNPQIAAKLFLSRRTVGTHVSHILSKLDVNSRIDIAREAASRQVAAS